MSSFKKIAVAMLLQATLQGFEPSCFYDYGYPPPLETGSELGDLFVDVEWLYLKPSVDSLVFAERGVLPLPQATVAPITAHRVMPALQWDSGVRASLGYSLPLDQWALQASYVYYRTTASKEITAQTTTNPNGNNSYIVPVQSEVFVDTATPGDFEADGAWKWNFQYLDIDLSRISYLNRAVAIRPNIGFRLLWSQQDIYTQFVNTPINPSDIGLILNGHDENDFTAFGVKIGIDTSWELGVAGLAFTGSVDWALLVGDLTLNQAFTPVQRESGTEFIAPLKSYLHPRSMKQMVHGSFGLQWVTAFNCESNFLIIKAAWEQYYFPNFNQLTGRVVMDSSLDPLTSPYSIQGDMGLYGFSLGAAFIF